MNGQRPPPPGGGPFKNPVGHRMWLSFEVVGGVYREDGPTFEYPDGSKKWYRDGVLHREDGPAVECPDERSWYRDGIPYRGDGPSIEWPPWERI